MDVSILIGPEGGCLQRGVCLEELPQRDLDDKVHRLACNHQVHLGCQKQGASCKLCVREVTQVKRPVPSIMPRKYCLYIAGVYFSIKAVFYIYLFTQANLQSGKS